MNIYFLFSSVNDEYICKYIYTKESNKIYSYSYDEGYIVKSEENVYKDLKEIEDKYISKSKKGKSGKKSLPAVVMKKEFSDVRQSLYFLHGNLDDFNNGIPARKRLPEIINPYDMDFEHTDDFDDFGESGFEETTGDFDKSDEDFDDSYNDDVIDKEAYDHDPFADHDSFDDDFDADDRDNYDDDDDDFYRR